MTTPRIDPALTVNEIILRHPAALQVLNGFGVDTCCGGALPLEVVARRHALDLGRIVTALESILPVETT